MIKDDDVKDDYVKDDYDEEEEARFEFIDPEHLEHLFDDEGEMFMKVVDTSKEEKSKLGT